MIRAVALLAALTLPVAARAQGYLRAGVGYERSNAMGFRDLDCGATAPPALFGCGAAVDGTPLTARGDFGRTPAVDVGIGRRLAPFLRGELQATWRPDLAFSGRANFQRTPGDQPVSAKASSGSALAVAYIDSGYLGRVRPFLGLGAGVARNHLGAVRYDFPGLGVGAATITPGGVRSGFAWMGTVGVGLSLSNRTTLDLAYRYTDLGEVRTAAGSSAIIRTSGVRNLDIAQTRVKLATQGLSLSVRWGF